MAFSTFSGSNAGNRAFQLNGEVLGGIVMSGSTYWGGLPAFTGATDGAPVGAERKYTLSRSFADADATGSIIQALNYLKATQAAATDVTFVEVNNALQESTGSILLGDPSRTDTISGSGPINIVGAGFLGSLITSGSISSSAGTLNIGGSAFLSSLVTTGSISSSAGALLIGGKFTHEGVLSSSQGATFGGTLLGRAAKLSGALQVTGGFSALAGAVLTGTTVQHGAFSSSFGATFVQGVIANTLEASSSVFVGGALNVTGAITTAATISASSNISGTDIGGQSLQIQNGAVLTGTTVQHGAFSSSYGATFVQGVIANTLEASSSIFAGGNLNVTGNISGTADVAGQAGKFQAGVTVTGSSVFHGGTTLQGVLSSSAGATFVGGVIGSTLEASSSVFVGGNLEVTGALSGTHFNLSDAGILKVEGLLSASDSLVVDGASIFSSGLSVSGNLTTKGSVSGTHYSISDAGAANFDGQIVNLGSMTTSALIVLGAATGSGQILAGGPAIGGEYDAANMRVSGIVYNSSMAKIEINSAAKANTIDEIPYIEMMGVDESAKLQIYKLQVSGGMFMVTKK